jgi:addiction module HigA family antidote
MQMHKPAHPGEVLREMYLEPMGLTVTAAAKALGITRKTLSELINGRSGISTSMALRLSKAFGTTPELWLHMQQNYDLWKEKRRNRLSNVRVLFENSILI